VARKTAHALVPVFGAHGKFARVKAHVHRAHQKLKVAENAVLKIEPAAKAVVGKRGKAVLVKVCVLQEPPILRPKLVEIVEHAAETAFAQTLVVGMPGVIGLHVPVKESVLPVAQEPTPAVIVEQRVAHAVPVAHGVPLVRAPVKAHVQLVFWIAKTVAIAEVRLEPALLPVNGLHGAHALVKEAVHLMLW
jgi:hypothetical protein